MTKTNKGLEDKLHKVKTNEGDTGTSERNKTRKKVLL